MKIEELKKFKLCYLASPYAKYPDGREAAYGEVLRHAADLARAGIIVFCPIAHSHEIARLAELDSSRHDIWLPFDEIIMGVCDALVIADMIGWEQSYGIGEEIKVFKAAEKPIFIFQAFDGRAKERMLYDQAVKRLWPPKSSKE
jgi:hypothetical protein